MTISTAELQAIRERDAFTLYKRIGEIEARPSTADDWVHRVERRISVSPADFDAGYRGGMIGRNPANHDDQWYIAPEYFTKHYASKDALEAQSEEVRRLREGLLYIVRREYTGASFVAMQLLDGKEYVSQP